MDQIVAGFPPHIHSYEALPGRPHWLRDINAPDLGWSEEADQIPAPDWSERDHRLECQGMVRCPTFDAEGFEPCWRKCGTISAHGQSHRSLQRAA